LQKPFLPGVASYICSVHPKKALMKNQALFIVFGILLVISGVKAQGINGWHSLDNNYHYSSRPYRDVYNHAYKHAENLWKDADRDGYVGYYDYNDRNPAVTTRPQRPASPSYAVPSYSMPASVRPIYTGPRGGHYYYNSRGKKVYVRPE
jgi:hypothetical protein